jgi:nucleotide-binding universal stress UspA family protein
MQRRIVVGVDAAREHDAALEFAVGQAQRRGSPLHLVVVAHPGHVGPDQVVELRLLGDELLEVDRALLDRCVKQVETWSSDLEVTTEVRHGPVAPSLAAAAQQADLLVLGHHRMTRAHHLPTWSVTSRVAAATTCPVYAVPDDWHELDAHPEPVVAAVEDPGSGREVASWAFSEAGLAGSSVRIVRAWCYVDLDADEESLRHGTGATDGGRVAEATSEALGGLFAQHQDVSCEVEAVHGQAAYVLVEASRAGRLLVIGRHRPRVSWGAHLGPVTRSVLAHARCPVVVVDTRPEG